MKMQRPEQGGFMQAKSLMTIMVIGLIQINSATGGPDPSRELPGDYELVAVNDIPLPAPTWVKGECHVLALHGTLLIDARGKWAALVEERSDCTGQVQEDFAPKADSSIFTGSYTIGEKGIEFHEESLGLTDLATFSDGILRYTVNGIGDFEGQTDVYLFRRASH
jgi:hypothetical protein